jgi:hypothetical protein
MNNKIYNSNNCVKISNHEYVSKYQIKLTSNGTCQHCKLYEYSKTKNDYLLKYETFNKANFLQTLKESKIKKYFSFNELELLNYE